MDQEVFFVKRKKLKVLSSFSLSHLFRLRIAKMNKEMREMDGAFGQTGHSGSQGSGGILGGGGLAHTRKSLQAIRNHISGWALGGQTD